MTIDNKLKIKMYTDMLRIREFEETVRTLDMHGKLPGFYHLYSGEEACAVGACSAINKDDYITSTHRGHGHLIAKGGIIKKMMAEMYAKETGYNKARGGSMHVADPNIGMLGANGIVGAGQPIATGAALSCKYQKNGKVVICFFGDGSTSEGTFHESLNIGATNKLPVVYFCENNLYGVGTRQCDVRCLEDIAVRASSYKMPGVIVDGNDVEAVYLAVTEAVERARKGEGPTLVEAKTYRHHSHFTGEPDNYRDPKEVAAWKERDPITLYEAKLLENGVLSEADVTRIRAAVKAEIDEAVDFAERSPAPSPETVMDYVYAD